MTTRKRKDVEVSLAEKGFTLVSDKDHRYYVFKFDNRVVARTKVSHGTKYKDLGDDLISRMARQCWLNTQEFLELVDCTLSQQGYEDKLRQKKTVRLA